LAYGLGFLMPVSGIELFFNNVSVFTIKKVEFWHLVFLAAALN